MARNVGVGRKKKEGYWSVGHFTTLVEAIFQDAINAVGNVGQKAIMIELFQNSVPGIVEISSRKMKPSKSIYKSVMALSIRQDKYEAVDLIIDEIAEKLPTAWDDSYAGDGEDQKLFNRLGPDDFIDTPPSPASGMTTLRIKMLSGLL